MLLNYLFIIIFFLVYTKSISWTVNDVTTNIDRDVISPFKFKCPYTVEISSEEYYNCAFSSNVVDTIKKHLKKWHSRSLLPTLTSISEEEEEEVEEQYTDDVLQEEDVVDVNNCLINNFSNNSCPIEEVIDIIVEFNNNYILPSDINIKQDDDDKKKGLVYNSFQ